MDKIVSTGLKLDLHIHSKMSSSKDGAKVKGNTLENIPLLIQKLDEQGVNICAITDHDTFSYEMYQALKQAEQQENSIKKVLPGVEFSVCFFENGQERVIHVVAIFSDEDNDKVRAIEKLMAENPPNHNQAYKEEDFLVLLRAIEINTILIAHQKNTLTSPKPRNNDANILGNKRFLEFVYTDYFEAFEFKNRRHEVLNKSFLVQNHLEEQIRFVTGTDCHDWSVYPSETPKTIIDDFPYTFAKCLPTFKGLVMSMTDHTRLSTFNNFFNETKTTLDSIELSNDTGSISIPLSKGINVIIGDNSVGKSLLLHAMTSYYKSLPKGVSSGYKKYLKEMGINVDTRIRNDQIFEFDMQGEVRSKFESNLLKGTDFLTSYFPPPVDSSVYRNMLENEISRMIEYLSMKFELSSKIKKLTSFKIFISENNAESLTFVNNIKNGKEDPSPYIKITSQIESITTQANELLTMSLEMQDSAFVREVLSKFGDMQKRYDEKISKINAENTRKEIIAKVIKNTSAKHSRSISGESKARATFTEKTDEVKSQISEIINAYRALTTYSPNLQLTEIRANSKQVYDYEFISKLNIEQISNDYFLSVIGKVLRADSHIDWETITETKLKNMLLRYDDTPVLQFFRNELNSVIEEDLRPKNAIIHQGMDKYAEMSSGLNAKIYFDLLAYETQQDGIYIIDQPEDNISQAAIRDYLLDRFKTMGENRQVIMVSHNPQFIVNLDIDNLIFLSKKENSLVVQSGALEYVCPEYNILDIVAQNIDGGLDSIRKRWKRYEKTNNI